MDYFRQVIAFHLREEWKKLLTSFQRERIERRFPARASVLDRRRLLNANKLTQFYLKSRTGTAQASAQVEAKNVNEKQEEILLLT